MWASSGGVEGEVEEPADQPVDDRRRADERLLELVDDEQLRTGLVEVGERVERGAADRRRERSR